MEGLVDTLTSGSAAFLGLEPVLAIVIGVFIGILIGVLPGLGPMLGVVLAIPFTFYMEPIPAMGLLLGIYQGGSFGGAISATVLGIPGTPVAAATLLDAYPMAMRGLPSEAVGIAAVASSFGGIFSGIVLLVGAPALAQVAMRFGPTETFALALLGLSCIVSLSEGSMVKGFLSGLLGLTIASVGTDPITGFPRFTFGHSQLQGGVGLVPLLVGVFAISEIFVQFGQVTVVRGTVHKVTAAMSVIRSVGRFSIDYLRASLVGTLVGTIPGVGGVTAGYISYNVAKSFSSHPERFGTGIEEGIIASEAGNNANCGGAMVPMMALGIPGDAIVAALMGGLLIHGLTPGPTLFLLHQEVAAGIFVAFLLGALCLVPITFMAMPLFVSVLKVPRFVLLTGICSLSIAGTYGVQQSVFDLWLMLIFGVVGYLLRRVEFPLAPLVIGAVLGPIVESEFRRTLTLAEGNIWNHILGRPIALGVFAAIVVFLLWPIFRQVMRRDGRRH